MRLPQLQLIQQRPFQLGRIFGIPLKIDYSWVPMALLHLWLVSQAWLAPSTNYGLPQWQYWLAGSVVTVLFFASILAHELAHALAAQLEGIQTLDIQLHIFGGWAHLSNEPPTALAEFRIAVAGPVCSFLLTLFFWLSMFAVTVPGAPASSLLRLIIQAFLYLTVANFTLAMFNLLPGLPLDGGRALRALLWHRRNDMLSATKTAKQFGEAIAYMLISYGLFMLVSGAYRGALWQNLLSASWLLVVGVYLMNSANDDYRLRLQQHRALNLNQANVTLPLGANSVRALMKTQLISVAPEMRVARFFDEILQHHRQTVFPVAHEGRLHGMLALAKLRQLAQPAWEQTTVREVMLPVDETHFIAVDAPLTLAAHKLEQNELGLLAVINTDGYLVGLLSRAELRQAA